VPAQSKKAADPLITKLRSTRLQDLLAREVDGVDKPIHMLASAAIFRAFKVQNLRVEAELSPLNLTVPRYEVLALLESMPDGRMSFADLKKATLLHPATMTYTMDGLEKNRLIKRRRVSDDRRAVIAEITPAGQRLARAATAALNKISFGLEDVPEKDARRIAVLLSELEPS
jgi:DNA-binding MarR family transcriptional regulator